MLNVFTKSCTFENLYGQYNAEHCGISDDTDDEYSV